MSLTGCGGAKAETAEFAYTWQLRSDNPVEITLCDRAGDYTDRPLVAATVALE